MRCDKEGWKGGGISRYWRHGRATFGHPRTERRPKAEIMQRSKRPSDSGAFILGKEVEALEAELAALVGAKHGVGLSSGSDALLVALMALDIGPGDEVLVPTFTFFATAGAVSRLGATPVFVDSRLTDYNMDPADLAAKISPRSKAVIPVHLFGQCAPMAEILPSQRSTTLPSSRTPRRRSAPPVPTGKPARWARWASRASTPRRTSARWAMPGCFCQ
jgi:hypothetical protein